MTSYSTENAKADKIIIIDEKTRTSTHYKHLLKKFGSKLPRLSFNQKCELYFDELYKLNHDWEVIDVTELDYNKDYKTETFDKKKFIEDQIKEYKKKNEDKEPNDGELAEFNKKYDEYAKNTYKIEQNMIDAVTHLRVFGQCYLKDDSNSILNWFSSEDKTEKTNKKQAINIDTCYDVEQRLFPWISREFPAFTRWDGETVYGIPRMSEYVDTYDDYDEQLPENPKDEYSKADSEDFNIKEGDGKEKNEKRAVRKNCFLNSWRKALNGKGIVISAADKHLDDLSGLIRVLRALNNKLPIQIVHKGDLSKDVMTKLVNEARTEQIKIPKDIYDKVKYQVPINFPKQEIWFVDAKRCVRKEYRDKFNSFANKLIAYLFNSFDEILLMDTDAVPLVKPIELMKLGPYKRTETVFFKDRFNHERVSAHDTTFFKNLMPSNIDESLFDISPVGNLTLNNRYMSGQFRHSMEAGVVGIKRSTHFIGILTSIQINFWDATSRRIWGDKELFWLGQSVAGNENYEFNKNNVVSVGTLTPMSDRPRNTIAHELCSTHPGHLSGDDDFTLLWINSGFKYCKIGDAWEKDYERDEVKHMFGDKEAVHKGYSEPMRINAALLPPNGDREVQNDLNEPRMGWTMTPKCSMYMWCAYDIIGASTDPLDRGFYIEYDKDTENRNFYLGKLWLNQDLVDKKKYEQDAAKVNIDI